MGMREGFRRVTPSCLRGGVAIGRSPSTRCRSLRIAGADTRPPVQGGLASPGPRSHGVSSRFHGEGPYMAWVGIVVIVALLQYFGFGLAVARARGRYQCPAPATSGHEMFERYYRVQMNTLEQLVLFLPATVLFAWVFDPRWAAALGVVWIVGRLLYFRSYVRDPRSRALGFALTALPSLGMLGAALVGLVLQLW